MSESQTIYRAHRTQRDKWTPCLNETIRDERISFRATGLLVYLLSLPSDWVVRQVQLGTVKKEGRDAMICALNELRDAGYVKKELVREKGVIVSTIWNVFETPQEPDNRLTRKPFTAEPETALPFTENPQLQKTEVHKPTKEQKTEDVWGDVLPPQNLLFGGHAGFIAAWARWEKYNRERRKKLTPSTISIQLGKLEKITVERAIVAIDNSIEKNYSGIYEPFKSNRSTAHPKRAAASSANAGTCNQGHEFEY